MLFPTRRSRRICLSHDAKRGAGVSVALNKIQPFCVGDSFFFHGAFVLLSGGKGMLVNSKIGTTLGLDASSIREIEVQDTSDDLQFKLIQRGFAIPLPCIPDDTSHRSGSARGVYLFLQFQPNGWLPACDGLRCAGAACAICGRGGRSAVPRLSVPVLPHPQGL